MCSFSTFSSKNGLNGYVFMNKIKVVYYILHVHSIWGYDNRRKSKTKEGN